MPSGSAGHERRRLRGQRGDPAEAAGFAQTNAEWSPLSVMSPPSVVSSPLPLFFSLSVAVYDWGWLVVTGAGWS